MKQTQEPNGPKSRKTGKQSPNANGLGEIIEPEERSNPRLILSPKEVRSRLVRHVYRMRAEHQYGLNMMDGGYLVNALDLAMQLKVPRQTEDQVLNAIAAADVNDPETKALLAEISGIGFSEENCGRSQYESVVEAAREALGINPEDQNQVPGQEEQESAGNGMANIPGCEITISPEDAMGILQDFFLQRKPSKIFDVWDAFDLLAKKVNQPGVRALFERIAESDQGFFGQKAREALEQNQ